MTSPTAKLLELHKNGLDKLFKGTSLSLKDTKEQCNLIDELMDEIILPLKLSTNDYNSCTIAEGFYASFDLGRVMFAEKTHTLNWYKILDLKPPKNPKSLAEYMKPISLDHYDPMEPVMRTYIIDDTHPFHDHALHRAQKETLPYGHYPQLFFLSLYRKYFTEKTTRKSKNPTTCFVLDFLEVLLKDHQVPYIAKKMNTRHEDLQYVYNISSIISFCTTFLGRYVDLIHGKTTVTFTDVNDKNSETINLKVVYAEMFHYLISAPLMNLIALKAKLAVFWINAGAGSPEAIIYNYASDSAFQINSDTFPAPIKALLKRVYSGSHIIFQSEPKTEYTDSLKWIEDNGMPTLSKLMELYLMWPLNAKSCGHHFVLSLILGLFVSVGFGRTDLMQAYGTVEQLPVAPLFTEHMEKVMYNTLMHYRPKLPDNEGALSYSSKMWKNAASGFPSKTKVKVSVEDRDPIDIKITSKINHAHHDGLNMFKRSTILRVDDPTTFDSIDNFIRDLKVLRSYDLQQAGQVTVRQVVGGKTTRLVYKMPLHVVNFESMLLNNLLHMMDRGGSSDTFELEGVIVPTPGNVFSGDVSDAGQKALDTTPLIFATGDGEYISVSADAKSYDSHQQMQNLFYPVFKAFHRYYKNDPLYNVRYQFGHIESFSPKELIYITLCSHFKSSWIIKIPILRCKIDYDEEKIYLPKDHSSLWWFPNRTVPSRSVAEEVKGKKDFGAAKNITDLVGFKIVVDDVEINDEILSSSDVHDSDPILLEKEDDVNDDGDSKLESDKKEDDNGSHKGKTKGKTKKDERKEKRKRIRKEKTPYSDLLAVDNEDSIANLEHMPSGSKGTFHLQSVLTVALASMTEKEILTRFFGSPLWSSELSNTFADAATRIEQLYTVEVVLIINTIVKSIITALFRNDRSQPKVSVAELPIRVKNLSSAGDDSFSKWKGSANSFRYSYILKVCFIAAYTLAGHEVNSYKFGVSNVAADYCQTFAFAGFYITINKLIIESSEKPKGSPEDPPSIIASAKRVILTMISRGMNPQFCLTIFIAIAKWHNMEEYRFLSNSPFSEFRLLGMRTIGDFRNFLFDKKTFNYIKARENKYQKGIANAKIGKLLLVKPTYLLLLPAICGGAALNPFFLYIEMTQALMLSLYSAEHIPLMSIMFHVANTKIDDSFLYSVDTPSATRGLFQQLAEPSVREFITSDAYENLLKGCERLRKYSVPAIADKTFKESMALESGLKRLMPKKNDMRFSAYFSAITNFNMKQKPTMQSKFWYKSDLFTRGYKFIVTPTPVPDIELKPTFITPISSMITAMYAVYGVVDSQTKRIAFTDSLRKILSRNGLTSHITPEFIESALDKEKINMYDKNQMLILLQIMGISIKMSNDIFDFYTRTHTDGSGISLGGVGTDEVTRVVRLFESKEQLNLWKSLSLDGPSAAQINNLYSQLALFFTSAYFVTKGEYVRMELQHVEHQLFPSKILEHLKMNTQEYSANFVFEDLEVALRTSKRQ